MFNIIIRRAALPASVHGLTIEDPAGDFNIYLNKNDPEARQRRALDHELQHIALGHFEKDGKTMQNCEDVIKRESVDISTFIEGENRPFEAFF